MKKIVHPDGKGMVPVLQELPGTALKSAAPKSPSVLIGDYLISLLVLSAEFSFKPTTGVNYYLYRREQRWRLSLIGPQQWDEARSGCYVGVCKLRSDLTWTLEPAERLEEYPETVAALGNFHQAFCESLETEQALEEKLPFYVKSLGFYQRALAHGLSVSLQRSMDASGLRQVPASHWLSQAAVPRLTN